MNTLKILGERLRLLRKEKRLRQVDVAELLNVTQPHYQRVEKGKINIPTLTLCFLADYYGVNTDYLLGRSEERGTGKNSPQGLGSLEKGAGREAD